MTSREKILEAIKAVQIDKVDLPPMIDKVITYEDPLQQFSEVAKMIGAAVMEEFDLESVKAHLTATYIPELQRRWYTGKSLRIVSTISAMEGMAEPLADQGLDPHDLENVDIAVLSAQFGVAENAALWVPETVVRVLPFICQHLVLLVQKDCIVHHMHQAYAYMGLGEEAFGAFIAGPSKTADIEQSLVLGAHGPRSLGIYLMG